MKCDKTECTAQSNSEKTMPKSIRKWLVTGVLPGEAFGKEGLYFSQHLMRTREEARKMLEFWKNTYPNIEGAIYKITSVEKAR